MTETSMRIETRHAAVIEPYVHTTTIPFAKLLDVVTWNAPLREHLALGYWNQVCAQEGYAKDTRHTSALYFSTEGVVITITVPR